ncbi:MAG: hypothetical protein HONDAALG_02871 [Gammaproteobacteria bacterium]|nr:hypothetical protein [Gammaproteobacteria bacterium]
MALIETLARGWLAKHDVQANEFVHRWSDRFQTSAEVKTWGDNSLQFTCDLSGIRLYGMTEVQNLLLGGADAATAQAVREFKQRIGDSGGLPFVMTTSQYAWEQARANLPSGRYLLISPSELEELIREQKPAERLKELLRKHIPLRRLIPYNYLLSVEGGMFFGRSSESDKLYYESDVSFAVAGPGRIGKTSLVKQYLRRLVRLRDPQKLRTFLIDFYHCPKDSNAIARFLAMKFESSRRSNEITSNKLLDFLQYQRFQFGGPLNLLLDEVDNVCQSEAFSVLGEAAKLGHCRLILIGKGELLNMMLYGETQLKQRLQLLRLRPLDEMDARSLLLEPLTDLGFQIEDPDRLVDHVFRVTGRLPHLMQFFAKRLAELAIDEGRSEISTAQIERLKWDYDTACFFLSPLDDKYLENLEVRLVAFLLLKERPVEITPAKVCLLARRWDLVIDEVHALKLCNELVIHNVLIWNRGGFQIANEALVDYARHFGLLNGAIETARQALRAKPPYDIYGRKIWGAP